MLTWSLGVVVAAEAPRAAIFLSYGHPWRTGLLWGAVLGAINAFISMGTWIGAEVLLSSAATGPPVTADLVLLSMVVATISGTVLGVPVGGLLVVLTKRGSRTAGKVVATIVMVAVAMWCLTSLIEVYLPLLLVPTLLAGLQARWLSRRLEEV